MNRLVQIFLLAVAFVAILQTEAVPPAGLREGFRDVALRLHNEYRARQGLGPLQLDPELNIIAHEHAEKLATAGSFEKSGKGYAENLWAYRGSQRAFNVDARDAINTWYTGSAVPGNVQYQVDRAGYLSDSVRYLGIGVGTGNIDYTVVVAEYY